MTWPPDHPAGGGAVPHWLAGPLAEVLGDLDGPEPVDFSAEWTPSGAEDEPGVLWIGGHSGFPVWPSDDEEALKVELAGWLQDQVVLDQLVMLVRPVCPGHPHPADPYRRDDGQAWWRCPETRRPLRRIGDAPSPRVPQRIHD